MFISKKFRKSVECERNTSKQNGNMYTSERFKQKQYRVKSLY